MTTEQAAPTAQLMEAARQGSRAVSEAMTGVPKLHGRPDGEQAIGVANFLGNVMFVTQIANGLHPRSAADFVTGEDRGAELARGFLTAGTLEICCDYCGYLMTAALAHAAAAQMRKIHGDGAHPQWESLCYALTGPPF